METIPWVEKYRPDCFNNIVLDNWNKKILLNMIERKDIQNLLFYGPPGTGKTTTIINIIKKYQNIHNECGKDLIKHLNASDERGIDIIRNEISVFVKSKNLFRKDSKKFVILDEVDYMTKKAQQSLIILINSYPNVNFCLICNYISKIEKSLQDSFIKLRFNQLPKDDIIIFLKEIIRKENINISDKTIDNIQSYFESDIRSMINYLQSENNSITNLIDNDDLETIFQSLKKNTSVNEFINYGYKISNKFNIDRKDLLKKILLYIFYEKNIDVLNEIFIVNHENIAINLLYGMVLTKYKLLI